MNGAERIQAIDALLPQTQCGKCGHPGCKPYAVGIAHGEALNKCPPGGEATIQALASLLGRPPLPLESPDGPTPAQIAFIREAECIGCTKCIQACPVDAIVGAARLMHTVITAECTGCELCVAPCPVDCIDLLPLPTEQAQRQRQQADLFRERYERRQARLQREEQRRRAERLRRTAPVATAADAPLDAVQAARARVKARQGIPGVAAEPSALLKRLKIEASMAQVALAKAEKQWAQHGGETLAAQVASLREAARAARQAWEQAQQAPPVAASVAPDVPPDAAKQARIAAAMSRAQWLKALKRFGPTPDPAQRAQLQALEEETRRAEALAGQLHPPSPRGPGDADLKKAKVTLLTRRAALRSAERDAAPAAELERLRHALADAERELHAAEDACGRPAPRLQRIDKQPMPAELRALKTELAYARAEVRAQQHRHPLDADALARAHARLAEAERRLHDQSPA
ncbi:electron transport complex subunit RsxB [Pseudomonas sp. RIT-PI-AD]|uniref:electron transport complex subunit RsxB n=1 Tax=Pseudomonas sp. RIT-PI-AD TaxID=3035294 RepID=UPI0021D88038|nr:electron transport complex subunit RsxB [Pseudomonas sp. RIT-PI-AD]